MMNFINKKSKRLLGILAVCAGLLFVPAAKADAHGWIGFNFGFFDPGSGISVAIGGPGYYGYAPVYPVVAPPVVIYRPAVVVPRVVVPVYRPYYRYPYGDGTGYRHHRRWDDDD